MKMMMFSLFLATSVLAEPFTYQGQLSDNGNVVDGLYDFRFQLYRSANSNPADAVGDQMTLDDVPVNAGVFTVSLEPNITFDGTPMWLEVSVRPGNSNGGYTQLLPLQPITATPEAQVSLSVVADSISSSQIVDGSVADVDLAGNIDPAKISGTAWTQAGNSPAAGAYLGTTNTEPLEFRVNGKRVGVITDAESTYTDISPTDWITHAPNVLLGSENNVIDPSVAGATIGGGGGTDPAVTTCGDGTQPCVNTVSGDFGTLSGGWGNYASGIYSTVGGGRNNTASGRYSIVGGGRNNTASGPFYSTVGGGDNNTASGWYSTVGGGGANTASGYLATVAGGASNTANGHRATVSGGWYNTVSGELAMVPGGYENQAGGDYSFAAGRRAKVRDAATVGGGDTDGDEGTFVWADSTDADFVSTGPNQFLVRASGGIWFGTTSSPSIPAGQFIATSTGAYLADGGTWTNSSDRNRKTNFQPIDPQAVLEKVISLPILRWNYKEEDENTLHLGPMAQDFHAAFGLGADDKHIATVDADGVALAAIQALAQENRDLRATVSDQQQQLATMEAHYSQQLAQLQQALEALQASQQQLLTRLRQVETDDHQQEPAQ